jgi:hypothetical protein
VDRGWPEDLDLWIRLLAAGARFAKVPRILYAWRQHAASATWRDPAYGRERFLALRVDALCRGLLADREEVSLVGVGASLSAWSAALAGCGLRVHAMERGRPMPPGRAGARALGGLRPPLVLVFGAPEARRRWREVLTPSGMSEGRDFVFVA